MTKENTWMVRGKSIAVFILMLLIIIVGGFVIRGGIQSCGWLDKIFFSSGCLLKLNRAISIKDVIFVSNKDLLVTSSLGGQVRLWKITDGTLDRQLGDYDGQTEIAITSDGNTLASSSWHEVQLQHIAGENLYAINWSDGTMGDIAFAPSDTTLAVAVAGYQGNQPDYYVQLWRITDGTLLHTLRGYNWFVKAVEFSPDGKLLASAGDDDILLWDAEDGTLSRTLEGNGKLVEDLAFSPDGTLLASTTFGGVRLWQISDETILSTLLQGHTGLVYSVEFSPDGKLLASGGEDGKVVLWRISDGEPLKILNFGRNRWVYSLAFSPDGKLLATSESYGPVRIFDVQEMLKE